VALAVDASSPARATGASTNGTVTVTTPAFNPPSSTVLVATVQANVRNSPNPATTGAATGAITNNSTALTWTKVAEQNKASTGGQFGYAAVFVAPLSTGRTGMTVTATLTDINAAPTNINAPSIKVYAVTGADLVNPVGGSAAGSTTTNAFTTTAFTTVGSSSMEFVAGCDWNALGNPTSTDMTVDSFTTAGSDISGVSGFKTLGAAGASATANLDAGGTVAAAWNWVTAEIKAAAAATPIAFAAKRRRSGAPPGRALGAQRRTSRPVLAPTTAPVGLFVAAQPRRDKFARALPVLRRRPVSVDVAVMAQATPPVKPRMPRRRRLPYLRGGSVDAAPPQLTPPRPRSAPRPRRWVFPRTGAAQVTPPQTAPTRRRSRSSRRAACTASCPDCAAASP
jgi:hypothetical protein